MSSNYTPPANDSFDFSVSDYSPPETDSLDVTLGGGETTKTASAVPTSASGTPTAATATGSISESATSATISATTTPTTTTTESVSETISTSIQTTTALSEFGSVSDISTDVSLVTSTASQSISIATTSVGATGVIVADSTGQTIGSGSTGITSTATSTTVSEVTSSPSTLVSEITVPDTHYIFHNGNVDRKIQTFASDGTDDSYIARNSISDFILDSEYNIYFTEYRKITKYDVDFNKQWETSLSTDFGDFTSFTISNDAIWAARDDSSSRIQKIEKSTGNITFTGEAGYRDVVGATTDITGNYYQASNGENTIAKLDTDANEVWSVSPTAPVESESELLTGPDNEYIYHSNGEKVEKINVTDGSTTSTTTELSGYYQSIDFDSNLYTIDFEYNNNDVWVRKINVETDTIRWETTIPIDVTTSNNSDLKVDWSPSGEVVCSTKINNETTKVVILDDEDGSTINSFKPAPDADTIYDMESAPGAHLIDEGETAISELGVQVTPQTSQASLTPVEGLRGIEESATPVGTVATFGSITTMSASTAVGGTTSATTTSQSPSTEGVTTPSPSVLTPSTTITDPTHTAITETTTGETVNATSTLLTAFRSALVELAVATQTDTTTSLRSITSTATTTPSATTTSANTVVPNPEPDGITDTTAGSTPTETTVFDDGVATLSKGVTGTSIEATTLTSSPTTLVGSTIDVRPVTDSASLFVPILRMDVGIQSSPNSVSSTLPTIDTVSQTNSTAGSVVQSTTLNQALETVLRYSRLATETNTATVTGGSTEATVGSNTPNDVTLNEE